METRVFTSAAPRGIVREIAPVFERMTGRRLAIESAFAAELKRRIEAGDPFDVAILAPDMADDLVRQGKLVAGSRVDLGRTGLGVAVRKGAPQPYIGTADAFRRALLAARPSPTPMAARAACNSMPSLRGSELPRRYSPSCGPIRRAAPSRRSHAARPILW